MCRKINLHTYYTSFEIVNILSWSQTSLAPRLSYFLIEFVTCCLNPWNIELFFWVAEIWSKNQFQILSVSSTLWIHEKTLWFFLLLFICVFFRGFIAAKLENMRFGSFETETISTSLTPSFAFSCFLSSSQPRTVLFSRWWMTTVLGAKMRSGWDHTNATLSIPLQKDSLQ